MSSTPSTPNGSDTANPQTAVTLIALVDTSPYSVLLAALHWRPIFCYLICTENTLSVARMLAVQIRWHLTLAQIKIVRWNEELTLGEARRQIEEEFMGRVLDYLVFDITGGTRTMMLGAWESATKRISATYVEPIYLNQNGHLVNLKDGSLIRTQVRIQPNHVFSWRMNLHVLLKYRWCGSFNEVPPEVQDRLAVSSALYNALVAGMLEVKNGVQVPDFSYFRDHFQVLMLPPPLYWEIPKDAATLQKNGIFLRDLDRNNKNSKETAYCVGYASENRWLEELSLGVAAAVVRASVYAKDVTLYWSARWIAQVDGDEEHADAPPEMPRSVDLLLMRGTRTVALVVIRAEEASVYNDFGPIANLVIQYRRYLGAQTVMIVINPMWIQNGVLDWPAYLPDVVLVGDNLQDLASAIKQGLFG